MVDTKTNSVIINKQDLIKKLDHISHQALDTLFQDFGINDYDHWDRPINTASIISDELKTLLKKLYFAEKNLKPTYLTKQLSHIINRVDIVSKSRTKHRLEKLRQSIQLSDKSRNLIKQIYQMFEQADSVSDIYNHENLGDWNDPTNALIKVRNEADRLIERLR